MIINIDVEGKSLTEIIHEVKIIVIQDAIIRAGNKSRAATLLKIHRNTIDKWKNSFKERKNGN